MLGTLLINSVSHQAKLGQRCVVLEQLSEAWARAYVVARELQQRESSVVLDA